MKESHTDLEWRKGARDKIIVIFWQKVQKLVHYHFKKYIYEPKEYILVPTTY